jgi:FkbM family methyltransferase
MLTQEIWGPLMGVVSKMRKAITLVSCFTFSSAVLRHGIAAAVEHLDAIALTNAATLIDIGANKGQFSLAFRVVRPNATIIGFEPLPQAADKYEQLFSNDNHVTLHRVALAEAESTAQFHVTDREDSSSLLKPGAGQSKAFGVSEAVAIQVAVERIDTRIDITALKHPILMKIDVQGAELRALQGCTWLEQIDFIYVELSFVELYEGQPLFSDVATYLMAKGFTLAGAFNQVTTAAFGPTQVDFLFRRQ